MRSLVALLALVGWASTASADENLTSSRDFILLCAKRLPETRQTVQVLKDEGWRYVATDGRYHIYSRNGYRVLAATAVTSSPQQGCMSAVRNLDKAGAMALATTLAADFGFQKASNPPSGALAAWGGKINGMKVALAAFPPSDFYVMRGAGVVLIAE